MRFTVFTATLAVIITTFLVLGDVSLKKNRAASAVREHYKRAMETAVDDACSYLPTVLDPSGLISKNGAVYLENLYIDGMCVCLFGSVNSVERDRIADYTQVFAVVDEAGNMYAYSPHRGGELEVYTGCNKADIIAANLIKVLLGQNKSPMFRFWNKGLFLPDETGSVLYKAASQPGIYVMLTCTDAGEEVNLLRFGNAQIMHRSFWTHRDGRVQ